ncbi:pheromone A receptor-domain-containing protein [Mycena olivaceomarginata]|nr:pheromone A receptor-domain-containing protein [Mycena olivaceomarginata]
MAFDPTYPLYPILSIVAAFFMFLILSHSLIRQSWNLAVTFLCIGLFFDNLTHGINAVVWRDNADIKVPVYCDLVSRLQFLMNFLPSITSLLITRRLHIISTLRDVEAPSRKTRVFDLSVDWGWGLGYPLFMTVVIYTLCQEARFVVLQGFGCASIVSISWFSTVIILIVPVVPPLISIFFYCPLVIRTFYVQTRSTTELLEGNGISRTSYLRILALGCLDAAITLPISITNLVSLFVTLPSPTQKTLPIYVGWAANHADFSPFGIPYAALTDTRWDTFKTYFSCGQPALLAVVIFALFGMTSSARSAYWSRIAMIGQLLGRKPPIRRRQSFALDSITFAAPGHPVGLPEGTSFNSLSESGPSDSAFESDSAPNTSIPHFKTTSFTIL